MKKNTHPLAIPVLVNGFIDHEATGRLAKEYRESNRIQLIELAPKLNGKRGKPMLATTLSMLEKGQREWFQDLCSAYGPAVDAILARFKK